MHREPLRFGHAVLKDDLLRMTTLFDLVLAAPQSRLQGFEDPQACWSLQLALSLSPALGALGRSSQMRSKVLQALCHQRAETVEMKITKYYLLLPPLGGTISVTRR